MASKYAQLDFLDNYNACRLVKIDKNLLPTVNFYVKKLWVAAKTGDFPHYPLSPLNPRPQIWKVSFQEKLDKIQKTAENLIIPRAITPG